MKLFVSNFIFVEEHVWYAGFNLVDALAIRARETPLNHLSLQQQKMQISQELLIVQHCFLESIRQANSPIEL